MDEKTQGLVLKLIDYKDADKLASIFTLNFGILTAKFVGVRKEKAKLKATAQPFTLADFNFNKSGNNRVVVGANLIDNFYPILNNYNKTICGYIVLDIIKSLLPEEKPEQDIFMLTVSAMKNIENGNEFAETIKFILNFLNFSGFKVNLPNAFPIHFDKFTGEFLADKTVNSVAMDKQVYGTLFHLNNNTEQELNENNLKQILRLLHNIIFIHFGTEIKSFEFI